MKKIEVQRTADYAFALQQVKSRTAAAMGMSGQRFISGSCSAAA